MDRIEICEPVPAVDPSGNREIVSGFWKECGLNYAVYGPGPVLELGELIRERTYLRGQVVGDGGLILMEQPGVKLIIGFLSGPHGSVCTISAADVDDVEQLDRIFPGFEMIRNPIPVASRQGTWRTTIFTTGSVADPELGSLILGGRIVPPTLLLGLTPPTPPPAGLGFIPEPLMTQLLSNGWHPTNGLTTASLVGTNVGLDGGRTQVVYFGCPSPGTYQWSTGLARDVARYAEFRASGIQVPEGYSITEPSTDGQRAMLDYPVTSETPPDLSSVADFAIRLGGYADGIERTLWGDDDL